MQVNYPLSEKYARVIGSISSRLSLLENKVSVTQTATSTASTGATITFSPTAPVTPAPVTGDLWYNTSEGNEVSQFNGTSWVPYQFGTGGIANNAITNALLATQAVDNSNLQAYMLDAGQAMTQFSGQNMITDGQFANAAITAARLADPATLGTWAISNAPLGTPFRVGSASTNSGTSISFHPLVAVPAGCALIAVMLGQSDPGYGVSDTQSNVYTDTTKQLNSFMTHVVWSSVTANALATTDTVTITAGTAIHYEAVMYAVPLGYGFDTNHGYSGGAGVSTVNFTTQNEVYSGDVNLAFVSCLNNTTYSSGGGTPSGWTYLGGTLTANWSIEGAWQYAPAPVGQVFSTSFPISPSDGWLATSLGVLNSGNAGHMNVTAQSPAALLPLMPTSGTNPAMYVNAGEQYYLSMTAIVPGSTNCTMYIQLVLNTGQVLTVSKTGTGYMPINGTVTIPPGASSAYARVAAGTASGTVSGCTILNPSCSLSNLSGSNWVVGNTGITVSGNAGVAGQAQLAVNSINAPALTLTTGVHSEESAATIFSYAGNVGAANEYMNMYVSGPGSSYNNLSVNVILLSAAADGSTEAYGTLASGSTGMLHWDATGIHLDSYLYGYSGTITMGDTLSMASGKNILTNNITVGGQLFLNGGSGSATVECSGTGHWTGNLGTDNTLSCGTLAVAGGLAPYPKPSNAGSYTGGSPTGTGNLAAWAASVTSVVNDTIANLVAAGIFN